VNKSERTMNCKEIQELLQLYLENRLELRKTTAIKNHLAECPECMAFLNEFKETVGLFKNLEKVELPRDYFQKLNLKIEGARETLNDKKPSLFRAIFVVPVFSAAAIIVVALFSTQPAKSPMNAGNEISSQLVSTSPSISIAKEQNKVSNAVETKEVTSTIEIAKAPQDEFNNVILRGSGENSTTKRFIKQWQDVHSGIKTKESLVIENNEDWQKLWKRHNQTVPVPDIDFKQCIVIAVFMGEQKTTGYGVQVSRIDESKDKIYIDTIETVPASDMAVSKQTSQPHHIVVVNRY